MKPSKLILLGCGTFGKRRIEALKTSEVAELVGVYDSSIDVTKSCAKEYHVKGINKFEDMDKLKYDGVIIATPNDTHLSLSQYFLKKGKYILLETPLVKNLAQLEDFRHTPLDQLARIKPANPLNYHPAIKALKSFLETSDVGTIFLVKISLGHNHCNSNFAWNNNEAHTTTDALLELGPNVLTLINFFGEIEKYTIDSRKLNPKNVVNDYAYGHFELRNNILVHFECDWNRWTNSESLTIESERYHIKVPLSGGNELTVTDRAGDTLNIEFDASENPLQNEIDDFSRSIELGDSFLNELKEEVYNLPTILKKAS